MVRDRNDRNLHWLRWNKSLAGLGRQAVNQFYAWLTIRLENFSNSLWFIQDTIYHQSIDRPELNRNWNLCLTYGPF